jgi:hypothetical protein
MVSPQKPRAIHAYHMDTVEASMEIWRWLWDSDPESFYAAADAADMIEGGYDK